jgi:hypothetical protein
MHTRLLTAIIAAALAPAAAALAQPVGTTFTYQGVLKDNGGPANGTYDLSFNLFDAATGGNQFGTTNCYDGVIVTNGLFTVTLSFGNVFSSGQTRWLEISARADTTPGNCGTGSFSILGPRQELTGTPTSIGLRLPFNATVSSPSTDLISLNNTGAGTAGVLTAVSQSAQHVITAYSSSTGVAVYGQNVTNGCYAGLGYGNWAVYAYNPSSYGVLGESASPGFAAIAGLNDATSGLAPAGTFSNQSPDGTALSANASATTGSAIGMDASSSSPGGIGVRGIGSALTGANYGVYGDSNSASGTGVFGVASSSSGPNYGVYGRSDSSTGAGVYGFASASSGTNYGVYGITSSASGYAGFFVGRSYFSDNVGLGALSPSVPLQVAGGSDLTLTGGGNIVIGQTTGANVVMDNNEIQSRNNGNAASLFINANGGNVGIGTNNAQGFQLAVNGSAAKPMGGSWSTLSDVRVKKNIQPLTGALDKLLQLRGVTFEYIDPNSINELPGTHTGMIAQEVETLFPQWVTTGPTGFKSIAFSGFEALTVEALRETRQTQALAQDRISALEEENQELRQRLAAVEAALATLARSPKAP